MVCKAARILALCLCCMAWLRLYAAAYAPEEIVGQPGMLLAAMSGNGSLSDETVMGDALADAIRQRAGAELAIVPGCAMTGNLEPKPQTYADVCAVLAEPEGKTSTKSLLPSVLPIFLPELWCNARLNAVS